MNKDEFAFELGVIAEELRERLSTLLESTDLDDVRRSVGQGDYQKWEDEADKIILWGGYIYDICNKQDRVMFKKLRKVLGYTQP